MENQHPGVIVHTLHVEFPEDLRTKFALEVHAHVSLEDLDDVLSGTEISYVLCVIGINPGRYQNEILFSLKQRNKGATIIVCAENSLPDELVRDMVKFLNGRALASDKVKTDILIDEAAMSIMEEEALRQTILYFEREMM